MKTLRSNKRVEADAVKQRAVSCCLRARAAHAQRYATSKGGMMRTAIRRLLALCILCGVASCTGGSLIGENLIQPIPFPGGPWKKVEDHNGNKFLNVKWTSERQGVTETVITTVIRDSKGPKDPTWFKNLDDNAGRGECAKFESETLKNELQNGYPMMVWKVVCKNADNSPKLVALRKVIAGEYSWYKIDKTWWPTSPQEDLSAWLEYFIKINVCNTHYPNRKCPEGYHQAN